MTREEFLTNLKNHLLTISPLSLANVVLDNLRNHKCPFSGFEEVFANDPTFPLCQTYFKEHLNNRELVRQVITTIKEVLLW